MQTVTYIHRLFFFTAIVGASFCTGIFLWITTYPWLNLKELESHSLHSPTIVLDDQGQELFRFWRIKHSPLAFEEIPACITQAFIATEDHNFFNHHGISLKAIARSTIKNMWNRRIVQGASTITQQLVKIIYTDSSRTFKRKIKEQFLSLLVEYFCTKEQILEAYLNYVYFGCGIYGIAAAAECFWNKNIKDLTYDEAATLAGIVKNPLAFCPLISCTQSEQRRNVVLHCLAKQGFLSAHEAAALQEKPLILNKPAAQHSNHLYEYVRLQLETILGKDELYSKGFIVQTTIDAHAQKQAELVFKKYIESFRTKYHQPIDGALISIDGKTGGIKVLIGGYSFAESQFNRIKAKRQLGSIFKPLVYAAGLQKGLSFEDLEIDEPFEFSTPQGIWAPQNVNKKFNGPMTRAYALTRSNNIVAIKTALATGLDTIVELAKKAHLNAPQAGYPALALGCLDCTPLEAVAMFNIFAQRGIYHPIYCIAWVKDALGNKVFAHQSETEQIIPWIHASQISKVLQHSIEKIKARMPELITSEMFVKTGTASQVTSCWAAGATPERTTVTYIGRDDNAPMRNDLLAMNTALPLWLDFHKSVPCSIKYFTHAPNLKEITIHAKTGERILKAQNSEPTIALLVPEQV